MNRWVGGWVGTYPIGDELALGAEAEEGEDGLEEGRGHPGVEDLGELLGFGCGVWVGGWVGGLLRDVDGRKSVFLPPPPPPPPPPLHAYMECSLSRKQEPTSVVRKRDCLFSEERGSPLLLASGLHPCV